MAGNREQGYVHHVAVVLDESWSMNHIKHDLIKAVDRTVETLARDSKEWEHETRVTIYTFNSEGVGSPHGHPDGNVRCQHYDKDVLRLPSIADRYKPAGGTPLIDATLKAIDDLAQTPELYGDHAFLVYVLTDGDENTSKVATTAAGKARALTSRIERLPDNWTIACFVPNFQSAQRARNYGYPNVAEWDATTAHGVEEVGEVIQRTTRTWMENRAKGTRSAGRSLFVGGQVDAAAIKAAKLTPLSASEYAIVPVTPLNGLVQEKPDPALKKPPAGQPDTRPLVPYMEIEPFISRAHPPFRVGKAYYELVKSETIKGNKQLAILEKKTGKVYLGDGVRQMLGLPEENKTVKPDFNKEYTIYVQSTSLNRHLYLHSSVMVLTK
jgi:hypothetical protein